jgi:hypothetical protein
MKSDLITEVIEKPMKKDYIREVKAALSRIKDQQSAIITEEDLRPLPVMIQKYLRYVGVTGKEKLVNMRIEMEGRIRSRPEDKWMVFNSVQYNFFDHPSRIFYIKASKMGIPAVGLHLYKDETAIMVIKLAGLFKVVDARGPEMDQGETVTVFNDMCCMAPATLIDRNIKWEIIDPYTVKAIFTNGHITVSATLFFNENGELLNFISNDRFETADGKVYKNYPWSTPIKDYREMNGLMLPSFASTIYQRPEGDFCYGEFAIKEIEYNCKQLY